MYMTVEEWFDTHKYGLVPEVQVRMAEVLDSLEIAQTELERLRKLGTCEWGDYPENRGVHMQSRTCKNWKSVTSTCA